MKGLIIIDFNRTLYDPEQGKMSEGAIDFMEQYSKKYVLVIIGKGREERRKLIDSLDIKHFFRKILLREEKIESDYPDCMKEFGFGPENTWSIGDRAKKEIRISNKFGIKTIWFKSGKFASEVPENKEQEPDFTVTSFEEINRIIPLD